MKKEDLEKLILKNNRVDDIKYALTKIKPKTSLQQFDFHKFVSYFTETDFLLMKVLLMERMELELAKLEAEIAKA